MSLLCHPRSDFHRQRPVTHQRLLYGWTLIDRSFLVVTSPEQSHAQNLPTVMNPVGELKTTFNYAHNEKEIFFFLQPHLSEEHLMFTRQLKTQVNLDSTKNDRNRWRFASMLSSRCISSDEQSARYTKWHPTFIIYSCSSSSNLTSFRHNTDQSNSCSSTRTGAKS